MISQADIYTHDGKTMTLSEWCDYLNIQWKTMWNRLNSGMEANKAFTPGKVFTPRSKNPEKLLNKTCTICGKTFTIYQCRDWREKQCSSECKIKARENRKNTLQKERTRECKYCGKKFVVKSSQIKDGQGKYCSLICSYEAVTRFSLHTPQALEKRSKSLRKAIDDGRMVYRYGEDNNMWKGGRFFNSDGYVVLSIRGRRILEHRHEVEKHIGRNLRPDEIVHHINHDKADNRIENLQIMTRAEHINEHRDDLAAGILTIKGVV